jgi:dihydrofolate synthase/folylpolyglutamate synthase
VKILIDGAHNNISADELQRSLVIFKDIVPRILIIGLSDDKDYQGVLHRLVPFFDYVITTRADNPRAKDPEELALAVYEMGYDCETQDSVKKAVERASDLCGSCGFICVTGSLFVAGEAIGFLKQQ